MARNYTTMAKAWSNTTMANPFEQNVSGENGRWWNLDSFLVDTGLARDILEESYSGLSLRNASSRTLSRVWDRLGSEKLVKDWIEYGECMEDIKQKYNVWWWTDNARESYLIEE